MLRAPKCAPEPLMYLSRLACVVPFLVVAACGQKLEPLQPVDAGAGVDTDGLGGGGGGGTRDMLGPAAVLDMAGFNTAGSPVVMITAPASGAEVHGDTLTVTATITSPTSTLIDSSTVLITMTPPGGMVLSAPMFLTPTPNVYQGTLNIAAVPSGTAMFTVSAADTAGKKGSADGTYVHDHGAIITFFKPSAMTAKGTVALEATVDDSLHPITALSQVQAGIEMLGDITLTQVAGAVPFRIAATIDLNSYTPPLNGPQTIRVQAKNSANTVTMAERQFTVDNAGPTITIEKPAPGKFIGGVIEIVATVTDAPTGVNESTVIAVVGNDPANTVALTRIKGTDQYHGAFDVRKLGTSYVLADISVRADDLLGNHGQTSNEFVVDNVKPWMTMDSRYTMQVGKTLANNAVECSRPLQPLGPESAYDGAKVLQLFTARARIEDRGNWAPGLNVDRVSAIQDGSVSMFIIHDDGMTPLAVDTDDDTFCDEVNPLLIPTTGPVMMQNQTLALAMVPLSGSKGGGPDYRLVTGTLPTGCNSVGDAATTDGPAVMCTDTKLTFVIPLPYVDPNKLTPIWTLPPVLVGDPIDCTGLQVDAANKLPEGPACVVTRASDNAGNVNVSFPLHICIDLGHGACSGFQPTPSHCTGVFDPKTMMLKPGTCVEPPSPSTVNPAPIPGTFPHDGSEVRVILNP
jgi:Bacterial Ig-like domain (group 3)